MPDLTNASQPFVGPPAPRVLQWPEMTMYFVGALVVAALGTWWIVRRGGTIGMDHPDQRRKLHERAVSRLGGAPIFVAVGMACLVAGYIGGLGWSRWLPVALCNALVFSVGFADDLRALGAKVKLVGQIGTALILYSLGVSIDILSNPFGEGSLSLGWWSLPITLVWLVSVPNIINLIDGMDGLAGGFGMFLCLTLAVVGYYGGQHDVVVVSLAMAGALSGFLIFNLPPAKIFLGDGGAYLIGFFVASVSLFTSNKGSIIGALLVIVMALGVPILDTLFAILRRAIRGVPIFNADAEHIHHRLILLGYSKGRALAVLYAVCVVLSLVGLSVLVTKGYALPMASAGLFLLAMAAARYLGYVRSWSNFRTQFAEVMERRRQREYFRTHGRLLDFEVERCETLEQFCVQFCHSLERMGLATHASAGTVPHQLAIMTTHPCVVHRPEDGIDEVEWNLRLDVLLPALQRCLERWDALPACVASPAAPSTAPSLPSHEPA